MARAVQRRTLETRARLLAAAESVIAEQGFAALRVEEVVLRAGTAKGTFFAHFPDKDALVAQIVGARFALYLAEMAEGPAPETVADMVRVQMPLIGFMTSERYVFDVFFRYSGAAASDEIGPIAEGIVTYVEVVTDWIAGGPFRTDVAPDVLAEGVLAFLLQAMAVRFCALHASQTVEETFAPYLQAWLLPR
ncbi:MAG: TetR/AcrR family transcriptional regulator [Pseudomonadota bacterium]